MISVIIPNCGNKAYLQRCIAAVKRQTYKNCEIILVTGEFGEPDSSITEVFPDIRMIRSEAEGNYAGLNAALSLSKGEYIFFCNMQSVLAPNTLDLLLTDTESEENKLFYGVSYIPNENGFEPFGNMGMSFYGKLFRKEIIEKRTLAIAEESPLAEYLFVAQYTENVSSVKVNENIYIYEASAEYLKPGLYEHTEFKDWDAAFTALAQMDKSVQEYMLNALNSYITENQISSFDIMYLAEEKLHSLYRLNYQLAKPMLCRTWNDIMESSDEENLIPYREYLKRYEQDSDFFRLLLNSCGCTEKQYGYLWLEDAELRKLLLSEASTNETDDITELKKGLLSLFKELDTLKNASTALQAFGIEMDNQDDTSQRILRGLESGLANLGNGWYYYTHGKIDRAFCGLAKNQYGWWYVENGTINLNYTGLARNHYGIWYVSDGKIDTTVSGFRKINKTGAYFVNGKVDVAVNGLQKPVDASEWYYFKNGIVDKEYRGLVRNAYGWYYVKNGVVDTEYSGFAENEFGWWYVENGKLKPEYNGVVRLKDGKMTEVPEEENAEEHSQAGRKNSDELQSERSSSAPPQEKLESVVRIIPKTSISNRAPMHILEIEDLVIAECRGGRVGFKTLWNFIKAWFTYKVRKGEA